MEPQPGEEAVRGENARRPKATHADTNVRRKNSKEQAREERPRNPRRGIGKP